MSSNLLLRFPFNLYFRTITLLLVSATFGCGSASLKSSPLAENNFSAPFPEPLAAIAATGGLTVEVIIDNTPPPIPLTVDPVNKTVSGTINNLSPGTHTILINYNVNSVTVASISASVTVTSGTTTQLQLDASMIHYNVNSIAVTPSGASIPKDASRQFTANGTLNNGSTIDITSVATWTSSDTGVATIDASGKASGVGAGKTTITAVFGPASNSTSLIVTSAVLNSISVTPVNPSIPKDSTIQFTATGTYSDGTSRDITSSVTWTSGNTSVAIINGNGLATGIGVGSALITATSGSISGNTTLTVTSVVLNSISVTPVNPSIAKGLTKQFTATGSYSDGTSRDITSSVTWISGNISVATINGNGLATGIGVGSALITAASGGVSGNTTLTVTPAMLTSISVTPTNPSIRIASTIQFTATGNYSDGTTLDMTSNVNWTSSNTAVAIISASGSATGLLPGSTLITATSGSISGRTSLTVNP